MRQVIIVCGKTRHGKSEHVKTRLVPNYSRVVVFDFMREYHDAVAFDDLRELIDFCSGNPQFMVSYSNVQDFEVLCDIVYHLGDCLFVVEEMSRVFPAKSNIPESFKNLLWIGGHQEVSLLFVAQRAASIDISIRSQYTIAYSFKQTEPADVKWLYDLTGGDERVYQVVDLQPYEYLEISDDGIKHFDKDAGVITDISDEESENPTNNEVEKSEIENTIEVDNELDFN